VVTKECGLDFRVFGEGGIADFNESWSSSDATNSRRFARWFRSFANPPTPFIWADRAPWRSYEQTFISGNRPTLTARHRWANTPGRWANTPGWSASKPGSWGSRPGSWGSRRGRWVNRPAMSANMLATLANTQGLSVNTPGGREHDNNTWVARGKITKYHI
jgi:hypothetical protein